MDHDKRLLIVGGTSRNVGKTELVCRIIEKISSYLPVYALKVSAVYPDEAIRHGNHRTNEEHLFEERRSDSNKDTSRMLRAGATRVFYLRGDDRRILQAYTLFLEQVETGIPIVCESNSLAEFVRPGLHLMVTKKNGEVKKRAIKPLQLADQVIISDGHSGFAELDRITYSLEEKAWLLLD